MHYLLSVCLECIVAVMSTALTLLGLLEPAPSHGYELKRAFDQRFGNDKPLPFGQVYATLGRFERDGRAVVVGTEAGEGPERKLYAITEQGVTDLERWLAEAEAPEPHLQTVLFAKVVLSLLSGRDADRVLGHAAGRSPRPDARADRGAANVAAGPGVAGGLRLVPPRG